MDQEFGRDTHSLLLMGWMASRDPTVQHGELYSVLTLFSNLNGKKSEREGIYIHI